MWLITLRDLQFRRRRFAITILGTALVFAMALALSGMSEGFRVEATRTVESIGADAWIVREGAAGPFTSFATLSEDAVQVVEAADGVLRADPLIALRQDFSHGGDSVAAFVIGYRPGGLGEPDVVEGRVPRGLGEAVADERAGFDIGSRFSLRDRRFTVVGRTRDLTVFAGVPDVFVPFEDAQAIAFEGQPVAGAVVTEGFPEELPSGLRLLSSAEASEDLLRPLENGVKTIDQVRLLLWMVATLIIGAVVYLSALERSRDFAVLKAVGASSRDLLIGLAAQATIIALLAAAIAAAAAPLLGPAFPIAIVIPAGAFAALPGVAVASGVFGSLVGVRRAVTVDPSEAFGAP